MSLPELIDAVAQRRSAFEGEVQRLAQERSQHERAAGELEQQRERNGREVAGYLLPDLDDEDLMALEQRLRYPVLIVEKRKTELELAKLQVEREQLEADPTFVQREVNRIDYDNQLQEIGEAATSFAGERAIWEGSEHFQGLHQRGWFNPDYDGGFFDWLRDWRACSLLMTELELAYPERKFPEDEDVKAAWSALYASSEPVLQLKRDLEAKLAALTALEARHKALLAAPDELFQELWQTLAGLIVDHLRQLPDDLLVTLAKEDEALGLFLKKDVGLKKQAAYLRELIVVRIEPYMRQLKAESAKLNAKAEKLRFKRARGKYVMIGQGDIARMRSIPQDKWQARRASFSKTRERLVTFDRWERGSFVEDYLWWDLITRSARGDDLYEVRTFHERNPGWSLDSFRDPLGARDAAADHADSNDLAADALADDDLTSLGDPS